MGHGNKTIEESACNREVRESRVLYDCKEV